VVAANGEIDADCTVTHDVPLEVAGEVLGDAAMCLIRGRSCRHNLLTLACPGRVRGTSSRRRDAGELSLLDDAHGTVAQRENSDGPALVRRCRTRARSLRLVNGNTPKALSSRPRIRQPQSIHGLFQFIEGFYNCHRLHSAIGYMTPMQKEQLAAAA
jgi:hypothetical protein